MTLHSQLITKDFPDLDLIEALNDEAFPEEERISLEEFLALENQDYYHFFAFYDDEDFVGFASVLYNARVFYMSFFAIVPDKRSHGYGSQIIDKLVDFYGPERSMVLEVERLDEPNDNPEQRQSRWDFYQRNGFTTSNAFLEYEGLSFEILYRGETFDQAAYEDIFHKLQEQNPFQFRIKHRDLSDI